MLSLSSVIFILLICTVCSGETTVEMSASVEELADCDDELLDIKPDISVLCADSCTTNADLYNWNIMPEMASSNCTLTADSHEFDTEPFVLKLEAYDEPPHTSDLCDKLQLPECDEKLHQRPFVDMYKPFLCIVCHQQFCTQEQLLTHSCPGW